MIVDAKNGENRKKERISGHIREKPSFSGLDLQDFRRFRRRISKIFHHEDCARPEPAEREEYTKPLLLTIFY
jgi:hypothetical protein